jgi:hypothetical protein
MCRMEGYQKKVKFAPKKSHQIPLINWPHVLGRSIIGGVGRGDLSHLSSVQSTTLQHKMHHKYIRSLLRTCGSDVKASLTDTIN